jgi:signal transduction histidine kinase
MTQSDAPQPQDTHRTTTIRVQFTLVLFLLAFIPNAVLTLSAGRQIRLLGGGLPGRGDLPLGLWLLTVAVLSAVIGWVLSGALLRPLSRLEAEVRLGHFEVAHRDDPAEIRSLRRAFVSLMGHLRTEQRRRSAFMATLVHDLKTPLIATGQLVGMMSSGLLPKADEAEVSRQLLSENARLLGLVQQMADAHKFEREDVQVTRTRTELHSLLERVVRRLSPQAAARGVTVQVAGQADTEVHAHVDAAVLERAVSNLADNALRYAHSRVDLYADQHGLSVTDDGPGLSTPLDQLAQPFNVQPVEIAGQRFTAGTAGLGLYIVRRIAEAHDGHLAYVRDAAAGLTTMTLHLPGVQYREVHP